MKTISHRQLRNESAEVLRAVSRGESYTVTNRGTVVARLSPATHDADLRCVRPATVRPTYSTTPRVRLKSLSGAILDDLRGDR